MTTELTNPRIYVACLAAYNAGILHGQWIDCTADVDELEAAIQKILKASPIAGAEEWAIHDYEGFASLSEFERPEQIADRVELHNDFGWNPVEAYMDNFRSWDREHFLNSYRGSIPATYEDKRNYCYDDFMDCCPIFGDDRTYFEEWLDVGKIVRSYDHSHTFVEYDKRYHIFCE